MITSTNARGLDREKPRDEHTEGSTQPGDKSLINRRLPPHPQPCAASIACPCTRQSHSHVLILDGQHKRLAHSALGQATAGGFIFRVRQVHVQP